MGSDNLIANHIGNFGTSAILTSIVRNKILDNMSYFDRLEKRKGEEFVDKLAEKQNKNAEVLTLSDSDKNTWLSIQKIPEENIIIRAKALYNLGLGRAENQNKIAPGRSKAYVSYFKALEHGSIKLPIEDREASKAVIREELAKRIPGLPYPDIQMITDSSLDAYPGIQQNLKQKNKVPFFTRISSVFGASNATAAEKKTPIKKGQSFSVGKYTVTEK